MTRPSSFDFARSTIGLGPAARQLGGTAAGADIREFERL